MTVFVSGTIDFFDRHFEGLVNVSATIDIILNSDLGGQSVIVTLRVNRPLVNLPKL